MVMAFFVGLIIGSVIGAMGFITWVLYTDGEIF